MAYTYGRPVAFELTLGNITDIDMAVPLLEAVGPPKRLLADNAPDVDWRRRWRAERRMTAEI